MTAFIYNKKIGSAFAILFLLVSFISLLLNLVSLAIIIHIPTVLFWAKNLLLISVFLSIFGTALFFLSRKAQWKSRIFMILLVFSLSNTIISSITYFKSRLIEKNSDQAKDSLNNALNEMNNQLQKSKDKK